MPPVDSEIMVPKNNHKLSNISNSLPIQTLSMKKLKTTEEGYNKHPFLKNHQQLHK